MEPRKRHLVEIVVGKLFSNPVEAMTQHLEKDPHPDYRLAGMSYYEFAGYFVVVWELKEGCKCAKNAVAV